jgi:leader peptidase (prepilin peptidase) / N-methyltransferase
MTGEFSTALPFEFCLVVIVLLGLLFGSFANVVIWRLPQDKSVVRPRSRCPKCEHLINWYDNIPVLSWVILRARCRHCNAPISWRYPLVEAAMGLLFGALFWRYGWSWTTLEYLVFGFGLVTVSVIDMDHMILPDEFTLSGIVIGLLGAALNPEREFMPAIIGVLMGGGFLWAVAYVYLTLRKQDGMGGGDIKLLAWIGAVLGWHSIPFVIMASSLVGSVVGLIIMRKSSAGLKASIPFGPYLALAALLYIFGGDVIGQWYLELFVPALITPN